MVHCKTQSTQMQGYKLHVMIHAPYLEDKSSLPNGVYVLKTYTELKDGSRNVSVVLRNLTGKTIHLASGRCVVRIAAANKVPEAVPSPELTKELAGTQEKETPKLTIEERQELLMELLRNDCWAGAAEGMASRIGLEVRADADGTPPHLFTRQE